MAKRNTDPISISTALGEFVQKNKLSKGIDKVDVSKAWFALNPAFETYTTSIRFDRETLFVNLSSSVFREELSYGKDKILSMINEELGREVVKKIVLR
ncbi:DUF721 domain-containing protein [Dokdonia sp. Hel_I_53]|uniref:DUF721 domain-containing protein n=1 Tax=Dokdonia sp. Hel_I_53 TaxID=1566287 RepID=UPI00119B1A8D|nr:DUF721 domain-containing protein [Dokdonia sp. Hel_I_53]TVZ53223.1 uncharacterized protein DUF721 [Dokdonia sp. Hel_I_53]